MESKPRADAKSGEGKRVVVKIDRSGSLPVTASAAVGATL